MAVTPIESLGRWQSDVLESITSASTALLSTSTRPKKRQIRGMQRSGSGEICGWVNFRKRRPLMQNVLAISSRARTRTRTRNQP